MNTTLEEKKQRKRSFKDIVPAIILSFAASFMLFLFAPLELYFTNKGEFWFDYRVLLPTVLVMFLIAFCISSLLLSVIYLIHEKVYQIVLAAYLVGFICSYIQGNFMVGNLPAMDGTAVNWSDYAGENVKSIILWVIVTAIIIVFIKFCHLKKIYAAAEVLGVCMTLMLLVTLVSVALTKDGFEKKVASDLAVTTNNEFRMSKESQNFIILVLDAVNSDTANTMIENNPEYKDIFTDFTFYRNTVCAYPFTMHSIPYMISGQYYENNGDFDQYLTDCYKTSPLLNKLKEKSYNIGIYENEYIPNDSMISEFDNVHTSIGKMNDYVEFAKLEIKLTGFKYAPFLLKSRCMFSMDYFQELRYSTEENIPFTQSNTMFYDSIKEHAVEDTKEKNFKFIHVEGGHVPYQYDKNMNVIENGTYEQNVEACMTITKAYLDKLKANGVYDNTAIIVTADHGYNYENTEGRQNPIMFIKGINETHDGLQVSQAPISYEDLQTAYERLIDGKKSTECFDAQEGEARDRRFLFYYYLKEDHMVEYYQKGQADDMSTLIPSGKEFNAVK